MSAGKVYLQKQRTASQRIIAASLIWPHPRKMLPVLPDPRQYPSNPHPLLDLVTPLLQERDLGRLVAAESALDSEIARHLAAEHDHEIAAAFAGADAASLRILTDRLRAVIAHPSKPGAPYAVPFAIPVVFVAGTRGTHTLPGRLPDIDAVKRLLTEHGILQASGDVSISARFVDRDQLLAVKPSQLARWRDALQYASGGLPAEFTESPIEVNGDGVFLRYLVGVAMQQPDQPPVVALNTPLGPWAMALTKLLGDQLKHDTLTLFPLPRAPQTWLAALDDGRHAQQEIRFQVFVSNTLRKLREAGETPVAVFSAHQGGELRVTLGAAENTEEWAGFVWPLAPLDRIDAIQHMMEALLRECHHDAFRVVSEVMPAVKDNLPYFPLPAEVPAAPTHH